MPLALGNINLSTVSPRLHELVTDDLAVRFFAESMIKKVKGREKLSFGNNFGNAKVAAKKANIAPIPINDPFIPMSVQCLAMPFIGRRPIYNDRLLDFFPNVVPFVKSEGYKTFDPTSESCFAPMARDVRHRLIGCKECFVLDSSDDAIYDDFSESRKSKVGSSRNVIMKNCSEVFAFGCADISLSDCSNVVMVKCTDMDLSNVTDGFYVNNEKVDPTQVTGHEGFYKTYSFDLTMLVDLMSDGKVNMDTDDGTTTDAREVDDLFARAIKVNPSHIERLLRSGETQLTDAVLMEAIRLAEPGAGQRTVRIKPIKRK